MILHLIRHPKPLIEPGICYGQLDIACEDPQAAAERLGAELPPGLPVWTSPLRRCRQLAELLDPQARIDARLAEMHFGEWEGRRWNDIPRHELDAWAANVLDFVPPGGESPRQLQARAVAFLASLALPEAVVVTHAGVIRMLMAASRGQPLAKVLNTPVAFATVIRLEVALPLEDQVASEAT